MASVKLYKVMGDGDRDSAYLQMTLDTIEGGLPVTTVKADTVRGAKFIKRFRIRGVPTMIKTRDLGNGEEVVEALLGYRHTKETVEKFLEVEK